jgi:copper(I)-binding protein
MVTVFLLTAVAWAQAPVSVSGAWARASAPGQTDGAVYLSLYSAAGDTLTGADTPAADMAMLHSTTSKGGMSGMQDMDSLPLPPGKMVTLAPHGMHLMLMGLKKPLKAGQSVDVDLTFAKSGKMHLSVPVQPLSAAGPPK